MKKILWAIVVGVFTPLLASAVEMKIPSQPLGASLQEVAKLSGVQIIFPAEVAEGRQAPALSSVFSVEAALDTLLAGTGLTYHVLNADAIAVTGTPIEEVEIRGRYEKLSVMQKEYKEIERRFYDEYNKVNTVRDYDISCESESHELSRASALTCTPRFVDRATIDEAWSAFGGHAGLPAILTVMIKTAAYQKHMAELVRSDPKLLELLMKRSAVAQRYAAVRKMKLKGEIFVWD